MTSNDSSLWEAGAVALIEPTINVRKYYTQLEKNDRLVMTLAESVKNKTNDQKS